ncbi:membrane protein YoeI [Enterobacter huaxiensis]|uniref:Membrane protein YoeI n=1 Tax=Enterobacter huaxiensis TaxID=2494702 RepID=A0A428M068_9ENTR|nr:membrane protein YoeI [Enterobacter huaxiensis]UNC52467.1 membrane protein YoeI [Enterobacter huaxiensis]
MGQYFAYVAVITVKEINHVA